MSLSLMLLGGCGLRDYLPQGPVQADSWDPAPPAVVYTGPPRVDFPVVPVEIFGLRYELDIVLASRHPDWSMHEYALIEQGGQRLWIAKDSDRDGVQTITAGLPGLDSYFGYVPVPRHSSPVRVVDRSTPEQLELELRYQNPLGQQVEVHFSSPLPPERADKRNSSTFDHSAQAVSAVLDVSGRQTRQVQTSIRIDGEEVPLDRVLGVPVQALLEQTQGGFALPDNIQRAFQPSVDSPMAAPWSSEASSPPGERPARVSWRTWPQDGWLSQGDHRRLRFVDDGLIEVQVREPPAFQVPPPSWDEEITPVTRLLLDAPLPDLRRPFEGRVTRHFVVEVEGQPHGHGELRAWWDEDAHLCILPTAPRWFRERPMQVELRYTPDEVHVQGTMGPCETG